MTAGENDDDVAHGRVAIAVAQVSGPARYLLLREGVQRHTLAQCSGIATASRDLLDASHAGGFEGIEAGTRKATPSIRLVEKYGMLFGSVARALPGRAFVAEDTKDIPRILSDILTSLMQS